MLSVTPFGSERKLCYRLFHFGSEGNCVLSNSIWV